METQFILREINLIPIMIGVLRRWYWIVIAAVIGGVIAGGLAFRNPQTYKATATIISIGYRTRFALEPRLETRESTLSTYSSRREALLQLATSTAIEAALPPETIETVASDDYELGELTGSIEAQQEGDLLRFTAHALSPEDAQILANAWAKTYVFYINDLLEGTDDSVIALTLKQVAEAETTYEEAKQAHLDFLRSNKRGELEHQVEALNKLFRGNQNSVLNSYQFQVERAQSLSFVLEDAKALRKQLSTGEVVAVSEKLAALLLRMRSVGLQVSDEQVKTSPLASLNIQIDESDLEQEAIVADLDRLMASVEEQLVTLEVNINKTANSLANNEPSWPAGWSLEEQEQEYERFEELRAQYEELLGQERALIQSRDVALEKLQVVERKLAEQQIQANQIGNEVRFATEALLPRSPVGRGVILRFIIGTTTGAVFGLLVAVVAVGSQLFRAPADKPSFREE